VRRHDLVHDHGQAAPPIAPEAGDLGPWQHKTRQVGQARAGSAEKSEIV